jgi:PII-like signaling protein
MDRALRASIFLGEDDIWEHKPLFHEIVHRAHETGLAGATVLRGSEGYGASSRIHTTRLLSLAEDLPVLVLLVDEEDVLRRFLHDIDELLTEATVVLDEVEVLRYPARGRE